MRELVSEQMDEAGKWAFACGVLEAVAASMLGRLERCDRHDTLLNVWDGGTLATLKRIMADPEWKRADLSAALDAEHATHLRELR
jgi:hypothetical protein